MACMGDTLIEAGEPPGVEMFGVLELRLSSSNSTGYCDVYPLKGRKEGAKFALLNVGFWAWRSRRRPRRPTFWSTW